MAQQVNILPMGLAQRHLQAVNADLVLDRFDTGKLLVVSGTSALTCSLPSASAVEAGFFATVLVASNHSHSVRRINDSPTEVVGNANQGSASLGGIAPLVLNTAFGVVAPGTAAPLNSSTGLRLEIYCDGSLWYLEGYGQTGWDVLS